MYQSHGYYGKDFLLICFPPQKKSCLPNTVHLSKRFSETSNPQRWYLPLDLKDLVSTRGPGGLMKQQVVIVTTDNGGPIVDCAGIGASNWPLRGGRVWCVFFFNDKQTAPKKVSSVITLPETNSSHLKMDGWNTIVSFWDGLFSRAMLVLGGVIGFGGVLRFP